MSISEGKSIGTAAKHQLVLSANLQAAAAKHAKEHVAPIKYGQTVGNRKLGVIEDRVQRGLAGLVAKFQSGAIDAAAFGHESKKMMKKAWLETYHAGLRAAGVPGSGAGSGKPLVQLGGGR